MPYLFLPPDYELKPVNVGPLLSRFRWTYGYTVVKRGASYEQIINPPIELFYDDTVDFIYQGGRNYTVSDEEAALLTAAGYGDNLTPEV